MSYQKWLDKGLYVNYVHAKHNHNFTYKNWPLILCNIILRQQYKFLQNFQLKKKNGNKMFGKEYRTKERWLSHFLILIWAAFLCVHILIHAEKNTVGEAQRRKSSVMEWLMFEKFFILENRQLGENMIWVFLRVSWRISKL